MLLSAAHRLRHPQRVSPEQIGSDFTHSEAILRHHYSSHCDWLDFVAYL
ncbi:hypothetical protein ACPOL_0764 [Acidisarcina polymorpha]|uniref:Uncharacterized protein n=1 Tax=Acidisarcina polymorpha TaxID=2211140 RepID=A0A2Z5FUU5_9BACT|nr:hypothetical protein ACPOL_0764 [Acidisarcina polymorpha]